uniref:PNPLA domain-containing protein n=1 Tax=Parastrongyloides trichosuri TaxID=131310 RepID=A0A0N4ZDV0_PARTI
MDGVGEGVGFGDPKKRQSGDKNLINEEGGNYSDTDSCSSSGVTTSGGIEIFFNEYKAPKKGTVIDHADRTVSYLQKKIRSRTTSPVEEDERGKRGDEYKKKLNFPKYTGENPVKYKSIPTINSTTESKYVDMTDEDIIYAINNSNYTVISLAFVLEKFNANYRDDEGNNYMHYVALKGDPRLLKAFLLYMEKAIMLLTEENNVELNPLDMISQDSEMFKVIQEFSADIEFEEDVVSDNRFRVEMTKKIYADKLKRINKDSKILMALDGGGIRGLCTIQILEAIDKRMTHQLIENIDWIAGTSTGSILSTFFSQGGTIRDAKKLYIKLKNCIFTAQMISSKEHYNATTYESYLKEYLGTGTLADITSKKLIIGTSRYYNKAKIRPVIFRNFTLNDGSKNNNKFRTEKLYDNEEMAYEDPKTAETFKVVRASSAAPTYFSSFCNYVDGGFFYNNPSEILLAEYFRYHHIQALNKGEDVSKATDNLACLISLGTGGLLNDTQADHTEELIRSSSDFYNAAKNVFSYMNGIKIAEALLNSTTLSDGDPVLKTSSWCFSLGVPFFRIQPMYPDLPKLDLLKDDQIIDLMWHTEVLIKSIGYHELEALAKYLDDVIDARNNARLTKNL